MPTYDFGCEACGHEFEQFFKTFREAQEYEDRPCPVCRAESVKRRLGAGSGAIFKGPGFHVNDYPRE